MGLFLALSEDHWTTSPHNHLCVLSVTDGCLVIIAQCLSQRALGV